MNPRREREQGEAARRVARRLRALRTEHDLTKKEAARQVGISRTYYAAIEDGQRNVSLNILEQLARAFDVPVSSLLAEEDAVERLQDERALRLARLVRFLDEEAFAAVVQVAERFATYSRKQKWE